VERDGNAFIFVDPKEFASFLHVQRMLEGCVQKDLAMAILVVQSVISDWEKGNTEPMLSNAMIWANALGYRLALVPFENPEV